MSKFTLAHFHKLTRIHRTRRKEDHSPESEGYKGEYETQVDALVAAIGIG